MTSYPQNCFADPAVISLQEQATARQLKARAPGTLKNHQVGARTYLAFMWWVRHPQHSPHHTVVCTYLEYLCAHIKAPATIRNYLSQARVHVALVTGDMYPLTHMRISRAMEAINRNKVYVPKVKKSVPMDVLRPIVIRLQGSTLKNVIRATLLVQYYAALRPGEVTPPTKKKFLSTYHLTRGDIVFRGREVQINIKSGKTLQKTGESRIITLSPAESQEICVVTAMRQMCMDTPTLRATDPLFMFQDRKPVPTSEVRKHWKTGLLDLGLSAEAYTLHGLRIAAATQAYQEGATELDVQRYGGWKSDSHRTYIRSDQNDSVNKKLIRALQTI